MKLAEISQTLDRPINTDINISGFSIDSRTIERGQIFVAIAGENFDGHAYIAEAEKKGAVAVICQSKNPAVAIPQIVVKDSLQALGFLAKKHREKMDCKVIALTGSNGKTTVKEMIANVLPPPSIATEGNLNNHIGVPLSVLKLTPGHRYAVFELGANHKGEIEYTVDIARPKVALINNIAPAHVEGFGSIDGVAGAKGEIYQGLNDAGIAIVNDDDNYAHFWDDILSDKTTIRFSRSHAADVWAKNIYFNDNNCAEFDLMLPSGGHYLSLSVPGEHSISNALAAAACCYAIGLSADEIITGINQFTSVSGRMAYLKGPNNCTIIDDSYNANLNSTLAALQVLASRKGKTVFVFGDMSELGQWAEQHHKEVGLKAKELNIDEMYTLGHWSEVTGKEFGSQSRHFSDHQQLTEALEKHLDENTTVLIKGSRSSAMDKVVNLITK